MSWNNWINVSDEMPEPGKRVIIYEVPGEKQWEGVKNVPKPRVNVCDTYAITDGAKRWVFFKNSGDMMQVTHWMYAPDAP